MEYITPEDMRELERRASEYGLGVKQLMENAGRGVAEFVVSRYGSARRVCVVCGAGNNGGDGRVMVDKADTRFETSRDLDYITPDEMRELEAGAAGYGLSTKQLMENAGKGVAELVISRYSEAQRVCAVCGGGNNGGDGFVAARYLSASRQVEVILLTSPERIRTGEARQNWEALASTRAEVHVAGETSALTGLSAAIADADVIVVAIFGTGVKGGALGEPYATAIALVNGSKAVRVAVDLPSGIDPSTGAASRPTVVADVTLALHLPKVGLRGREEYTGEVVVVPIGIRSEGA